MTGHPPKDAQDPCAEGECDEALRALETYLDGELPEERLDELERHLSSCYPCTDRATFEERLRAIIRSRCVDNPPERLVTRIRDYLAVQSGKTDPD